MIDVNFGSLISPELALAIEGMPQILERILDDVIAVAKAQWELLAKKNLRSTSKTYIQGIGATEGHPGMRQITLNGFLPNAIEGGLESYDLRESILWNPNAKARHPILGKNGEFLGWYANIPFRHFSWHDPEDKSGGGPEGQASSGMSMGEQWSMTRYPSRRSGGHLTIGDAAQFGKELYDLAKGIATRKIDKQNRVLDRGGSLQEDAIIEVMKRHGINNPLLRSHHKSSIYAGMYRVRKTYQRATQSQYFTFRRISTRKTEGWIHPGIQARHLLDGVASHLEMVTPQMVANIATQFLGKGP